MEIGLSSKFDLPNSILSSFIPVGNPDYISTGDLTPATNRYK
ncbi:hypothetical protein [Fischerella thermalis]|nr:hypothetical protein [Fischerella thermalis]